jgi:hypothetical protein
MRQEKKETAGGAEFSGGVALSGVIISRTTLHWRYVSNG